MHGSLAALSAQSGTSPASIAYRQHLVARYDAVTLWKDLPARLATRLGSTQAAADEMQVLASFMGCGIGYGLHTTTLDTSAASSYASPPLLRSALALGAVKSTAAGRKRGRASNAEADSAAGGSIAGSVAPLAPFHLTVDEFHQELQKLGFRHPTTASFEPSPLGGGAVATGADADAVDLYVWATSLTRLFDAMAYSVAAHAMTMKLLPSALHETMLQLAGEVSQHEPASSSSALSSQPKRVRVTKGQSPLLRTTAVAAESVPHYTTPLPKAAAEQHSRTDDDNSLESPVYLYSTASLIKLAATCCTALSDAGIASGGIPASPGIDARRPVLGLLKTALDVLRWREFAEQVAGVESALLESDSSLELEGEATPAKLGQDTWSEKTFKPHEGEADPAWAISTCLQVVKSLSSQAQVSAAVKTAQLSEAIW
jgi:hypothetical protein